MKDSYLERTLAPAQSYFCLSMINSGLFVQESSAQPKGSFCREAPVLTQRASPCEASGPHARWLIGARGHSETKSNDRTTGFSGLEGTLKDQSPAPGSPQDMPKNATMCLRLLSKYSWALAALVLWPLLRSLFSAQSPSGWRGLRVKSLTSLCGPSL